MRVAAIHYHLGDGGVAGVMRRVGRGLAGTGIEQALLTGEPVAEDGGGPVRIVEGLGYGGGTAADGPRLADRLRQTAQAALGGRPDVWHVHNHALGKNPALTAAVVELALAGERLVLHLHDLAEDGRPQLYRRITALDQRYPQGPRIRYVFLNGRDRATFVRAGLAEAWASVLPNPVEPRQAWAQATEARMGDPLVFAPVRGIRRKNLGELVLWSVLGPREARLAVSLTPREGEARRLHDRWQAFAREFAPRIEFAVSGRLAPVPGGSCAFESWIRHCTHVVGTSVAEGFGLPFAEAAAWGKPFIGRNLPWLGHPLDPNGVYERLLVPADWVGRTVLREWTATTLERNHRAWGLPLRRAQVDATVQHLWGDGWLDFGNLPEAIQQGIIERCTDPVTRCETLVESSGRREEAATWWAGRLACAAAPSAAQGSGLDPAAYQERLILLYQELLASEAHGVSCIDPHRVLAPHTVPAAFHFLLSDPPPDGGRRCRFRAVICDVYGTLLDAPPGGVRPDPKADPLLRRVIGHFGHQAPESPSLLLHEAVLRHHRQSAEDFPEVDLRELWREVLGLRPETDTTALVTATEDAWHPARPMPGAEDALRRLVSAGVPVGLLSNAQCNTLVQLGGLSELLEERLVVLSYRHGMAKPSRRLFEILVARLETMGIQPGEVLFIGNDPQQDIRPAADLGFVTAWFTGEADRENHPPADFVLRRWSDLGRIVSAKMHIE